MENVTTKELLQSIEKFQGICKSMHHTHPRKPVVEEMLMRLYAEMAKREAA